MNFWIDPQLPPSLAAWLTETFAINAIALRDIGLRDAKDTEIFNAARSVGTVIMTKDSDFVDLVSRLGTPAQILRAMSDDKPQRIKATQCACLGIPQCSFLTLGNSIKALNPS